MSLHDTEVSMKEWLDLAWKHFLQHAQQRVQYFNYFVIFSTILTTGIVTTFQQNFQARHLGIGLGMIQIFLAYMFWKIDIRNKFLTKHAEDIIKEIEKNYCSVPQYRLFTLEEKKTLEQFKADKSKWLLQRQISHGSSYSLIYTFFFLIGIAGVIISIANSSKEKYEVKPTTHEIVFFQVDSALNFRTRLQQIDSLNKNLIVRLDRLLLTEDSLKMLMQDFDMSSKVKRKDTH